MDQDPEARIAELERQLGVTRAAGSSAPPPAGPASAQAPWSALPPAQFASVDSRLAESPRRIPAVFWLAEILGFRWWGFLVLMVVGLGPLALWMKLPAAFTVIVVLTILGIYGYQLWGMNKRFALLKWGQVARVTGSQMISQGTYYGGTTLKNMRVPIAHGWKVIRPMYSGPSTKTLIRYTLNGCPGELTVSGREYIDGVVLADPRDPVRALCVTSFAYDLDRDESGNWIGRIRPGLMFGMALWLTVSIGWLALALVVATDPDGARSWFCNLPGSNRGLDCSDFINGATTIGTAQSSGPTSLVPGGNLRVGGFNVNETVPCNEGNLTLYGSGTFKVTGRCASLTVGATNSQIHVESADTIKIQGYQSTYNITGHCASLTVSKNGNQVLVGSVDTINVSSYDNSVAYRSGSPKITDIGRSNTIAPLG